MCKRPDGTYHLEKFKKIVPISGGKPFMVQCMCKEIVHDPDSVVAPGSASGPADPTLATRSV